MTSNVPAINELRRLPSPAFAPQALAWHRDKLWVSSREARRLYGINAPTWAVVEEMPAPGILWAAVSTPDALYFTSGEDADDDRYLRPLRTGTRLRRILPCCVARVDRLLSELRRSEPVP